MDYEALRDTIAQALLSDSPPLDKIPGSDCTDLEGISIAQDQHSVSRPQGEECNVGAFELQVAPVSYTLTTSVDGASTTRTVELQSSACALEPCFGGARSLASGAPRMMCPHRSLVEVDDGSHDAGERPKRSRVTYSAEAGPHEERTKM